MTRKKNREASLCNMSSWPTKVRTPLSERAGRAAIVHLHNLNASIVEVMWGDDGPPLRRALNELAFKNLDQWGRSVRSRWRTSRESDQQTLAAANTLSRPSSIWSLSWSLQHRFAEQLSNYLLFTRVFALFVHPVTAVTGVVLYSVTPVEVRAFT